MNRKIETQIQYYANAFQASICFVFFAWLHCSISEGQQAIMLYKYLIYCKHFLFFCVESLDDFIWIDYIASSLVNLRYNGYNLQLHSPIIFQIYVFKTIIWIFLDLKLTFHFRSKQFISVFCQLLLSHHSEGCALCMCNISFTTV